MIEPWTSETVSDRLGCAMIYIPPGPFLMGSDPIVDPQADRHEQPQHTLDLPGFFIGRFPVTNAEYRRFTASGAYADPSFWSEQGWRTRESANENWDYPARSAPGWTGPESLEKPGWNAPQQPVSGVGWYEAEAYCRWLSVVSGLSVTLPGEPEWVKAARGDDGRIYPWGNTPPTSELACFNLRWNADAPCPVGAHSPQGDSPYGCADLAGNVDEWTRSGYWVFPYDLTRETGTSFTRVLKGGGFASNARGIRCTQRWSVGPADRERDGHVVRSRDWGFRLVVHLPETRLNPIG